MGLQQVKPQLTSLRLFMKGSQMKRQWRINTNLSEMNVDTEDTKKITVLRMMRAAMEAEIPKKRGFQDVSISEQDLCSITRYDGSQKAVAKKFHALPKNWPKVIDKITDLDHKWNDESSK